MTSIFVILLTAAITFGTGLAFVWVCRKLATGIVGIIHPSPDPVYYMHPDPTRPDRLRELEEVPPSVLPSNVHPIENYRKDN